jgi:MoaA/NifB/PqqE/SkfB family radical SAM enzyme
MEEAIKRLVNWFDGNPQPPFRLMISLTSRCNLRCKFCDKWRVKTKERLKKEHLIRLIKNVKKVGVKEIHFSGGGEPFFKKKLLLQAMEEVKKCGMKGLVVTNGTLIKKEDLEKLIHIGWDVINFSLDSYSAKIHNRFRGKGTFERTVKSILLLNTLKTKYNSFLPKVSISTIINKENFKDLTKFIFFARKLGSDSIHFQYVRSITKEAFDLRVDFDEIKFYLKKALKLVQKFKIDTNLRDFVLFENIGSLEDIGKILLNFTGRQFPFSIPCYYPWYIMMVNEEGKIGPCPVWASKSDVDIFSFSLDELWYGEYFSFFREKMIRKNVVGCICGAPTVHENKFIREELKNFILSGVSKNKKKIENDDKS